MSLIRFEASYLSLLPPPSGCRNPPPFEAKSIGLLPVPSGLGGFDLIFWHHFIFILINMKKKIGFLLYLL